MTEDLRKQIYRDTIETNSTVPFSFINQPKRVDEKLGELHEQEMNANTYTNKQSRQTTGSNSTAPTSLPAVSHHEGQEHKGHHQGIVRGATVLTEDKYHVVHQQPQEDHKAPEMGPHVEGFVVPGEEAVKWRERQMRWAEMG